MKMGNITLLPRLYNILFDNIFIHFGALNITNQFEKLSSIKIDWSNLSQYRNIT